ncbi:hypothetical protein JHK84_031809 [Glycine max]|nr:hypothetical protein JHK86_031669 [Glycine max]KAG5146266.1 hypothetical protein JHK84_031809 [Glycine max]
MTTTNAPIASTPSPRSLSRCTPVYSFQAVFHVDRNYIEVPRSYHKQWAPHYPAYVKIEYNGAPHIIKLLPTEVVHFVDASTPFMTVQHSSGVRDIWTISMHNGEQHVDDPWNRLLTDNDLMGGDEVIFYYWPNEHVWEIIFRKEPIWDEDDDST